MRAIVAAHIYIYFFTAIESISVLQGTWCVLAFLELISQHEDFSLIGAVKLADFTGEPGYFSHLVNDRGM